MSQARQASLGIDVAKVKFDAAVLCAGKLAQRTFSMDPAGFAALELWIRQQGVEQVHVCLEATGEYGAALALALYESGHLVSIVNPARSAAYAKSRRARTKTDKADAALIAHFCCTRASASLDPSRYRGPRAAGAGAASGDAGLRCCSKKAIERRVESAHRPYWLLWRLPRRF
jgi:hypothetical protein